MPPEATPRCPYTVAHVRCVLDDDHAGYCRTSKGSDCFDLAPRELDPRERYALMGLPIPARLVENKGT